MDSVSTLGYGLVLHRRLDDPLADLPHHERRQRADADLPQVHLWPDRRVVARVQCPLVKNCEQTSGKPYKKGRRWGPTLKRVHDHEGDRRG